MIYKFLAKIIQKVDTEWQFNDKKKIVSFYNLLIEGILQLFVNKSVEIVISYPRFLRDIGAKYLNLRFLLEIRKKIFKKWKKNLKISNIRLSLYFAWQISKKNQIEKRNNFEI